MSCPVGLPTCELHLFNMFETPIDRTLFLFRRKTPHVHVLLYYRNVRRDFTAWIGWHRSHHSHLLLTRQKRCFYKGRSLTWGGILKYKKYTQIHLKEDTFLYQTSHHIHCSPDQIYWQIKKKWQVILKITTKTCITLRRLPLFLPTSGPIPRVLGCGLTSHFGDSNIPKLKPSPFTWQV